MENKVKRFREGKGITQEQLAHSTEVSRQSIISIEKGHYIPTTVLALKIAYVLKTKVEELFVLENTDWK
jgi:putative transcriptional regulator